MHAEDKAVPLSADTCELDRGACAEPQHTAHMACENTFGRHSFVAGGFDSARYASQR
jgi:hypothetical protein